MNNTVTFHIELWHFYAVAKVVSSIFITRKQMKYLRWENKQKVSWQLHHVIRGLFKNFFINPEWAFLKMIAFVPVYLFTGTKYISRFKPWGEPVAPPKCDKCKDKGTYENKKGFLTGTTTELIQCECQKPKTDSCKFCQNPLDCPWPNNPNDPLSCLCNKCVDAFNKVYFLIPKTQMTDSIPKSTVYQNGEKMYSANCAFCNNQHWITIANPNHYYICQECFQEQQSQ